MNELVLCRDRIAKNDCWLFARQRCCDFCEVISAALGILIFTTNNTQLTYQNDSRSLSLF